MAIGAPRVGGSDGTSTPGAPGRQDGMGRCQPCRAAAHNRYIDLHRGHRGAQTLPAKPGNPTTPSPVRRVAGRYIRETR